MADPLFRIEEGSGPLIATAIHDGHSVRQDLEAHLALPAHERLREEDPFTGQWTHVAPTRVVGTRSRFEVDLNRPREKAVYRTPEDAWGLRVWHSELPEPIAARSLELYDHFYENLQALYRRMAAEHGVIVVFDLHTYNHRRSGPNGELADPTGNPQVNVGTGTLAERARFSRLIDRFMEDLAGFPFPGGRLDVRENVKFFGGNHARWTHEVFGESACVLAIEFKKFFMDEWTGEADHTLLAGIQNALASTVPGVLDELAQLRT